MFFATNQDQSTHPTAEQHKAIRQWLWRTFVTRRYSKRLEQFNEDIVEVRKLKNGGSQTPLVSLRVKLDNHFSRITPLTFVTLNTKTFILMLASEGPLDFVGGGKVELGPVLRECNKKEFHHVYPRAYLESLGVKPTSVNAMVNFCLLPRAGNNKISGRRPSEYRSLMPPDEAQLKEILRRALCPDDIFHNNYSKFVEDRAEILVGKAKELMGMIGAQP